MTGWLARDVHRWAIQLTTYCVAVGLVGFYVIGWVIAIDGSGSSRRRMQFRAIGTTLVGLAIAMILESAALIGVVDYSEVWSRLTGEWAGPSTNYQTDYEFGFRHPSNTKWYGRPRSDMAVTWNLTVRRPAPMTFTTDSRGFRNLHERPTADVVLLGDSYVEGAYVSDDENCAAVLERDFGLKVTNLALAGYGTLQELEVLKRLAVPMKPRLIAWFFFEGNDLYDDEGFEGSLPYLRERKPYHAGRWDWSWNDFLNRSFIRTTFRTVRRGLDPLVPNNVATFGTFRDANGIDHRMYFYDYASIGLDDYELQRFEKSKAAFRIGRQMCDENGISLVLFYIPMKFRVYGDFCKYPPGSLCREWKPWKLADHFREFCKRESQPFVDLTEPMKAQAAAGKLLYAPEDSHWGIEGQKFVANSVLKQWEIFVRTEK